LTINKIPLVSVILTTQNRAQLLKRAIDSVINQTYFNIEIIIVDDASMDNTEEVVQEYIKQDSRVQYLKNKQKLGANVSRNKGILASKGKFIAGLDDDDEFMPNRIELLIKNYDDNYAFITSNNLIVKDGSLTISSKKPIIYLEDMLYNNRVDNQACIEKSRLQEVGLYDEKLTACQDYDMWMRLILKYGNVKVIEEATQIIYRNSSLQRISTNSKNKYYGYYNFYKKYKYLMNEYYRKVHLIRIYDIKSNNDIASELAVKILINKIKNSPVNNFSIFGINTIAIEIIKFLNNNKIKINFLIDSNKRKQKIGNHMITTVEEVIGVETNFIICSISSYEQIKTLLHECNQSKQPNLISI